MLCNDIITNPRNVVTKYGEFTQATLRGKQWVFCSHECYQFEFDRQIDERELKQLQLKDRYKNKAAEYAKKYRLKKKGNTANARV